MIVCGTVIHQRYEVHRLLGKGGMGAVYEATDQRRACPVALKQMLSHGDAAERQFMHEAHILAGLRHSALPLVSDFFVEQGAQFLVMDYIAGYTLGEELAQRGAPFPVVDVIGWADQLLSTLKYLHTNTPPIIHRDIKPHNIKVTSDKSIVLLDFGLSKRQLATDLVSDDAPSAFGYTLGFAPIEQIRGDGTDTRSDLYALGATLYMLLCGQTPASSPRRLAARINGLPDPLVPLSERNLHISDPFNDLIMQLLALHPDDRPRHSDEVQARLRKIATVSLPRIKRLSIQPSALGLSLPPPVLIYQTPQPPEEGNSASANTVSKEEALHTLSSASPRSSIQWWFVGEWLIWFCLLSAMGYVAAHIIGGVIGMCVCLILIIMVGGTAEEKIV